MNLNIETTTQDKFYEVKVGGELDVYTVPELEEVLTPMRQDGTRDIYVNLENVSYNGFDRFRFIRRYIKSIKPK